MKSEKLIIHLTLPEDYLLILRNAILDELKVASKKWGVRLLQEDKDAILKHAQNQLRRKVSESARIEWDFGQELSLKVNASKSREVRLPNVSARDMKINLKNSRDGWEIDKEGLDENLVKLSEFHTFFFDKMQTWVRTAVFYGVSSYAQ